MATEDAGILRGKTSLATRLSTFLGQAAASMVDSFRTGGTGSGDAQFGPATDGRGFTPGQPLGTAAPKGSLPRQFEVLQGRNLVYTPRTEDVRLTPFRTLRALADSQSATRAIISSIKHSHQGTEWDIAAKEGADGKSPAAQAAMARVKDFLRRPDRATTWSAFVGKMVEEVLVTDALTLLPIRNRAGEPLALQILDGATIKPLVDVYGNAPLPPAPAYQQVLYGRPETEFSLGEIYYLPRNTRTWTPYGQAPVEMVAVTVNLALRRELHYLAFYTDGNLPDAIYQMPESWTDKQIKEFEERWDSILAGQSDLRAGRVKFLPGGPGSGLVNPKDHQWSFEFDEYLGRVLSFAFDVAPIWIAKVMNRATAGELNRLQREVGVASLRKFLAQAINDVVLVDLFGIDWANFIWMDEQEGTQDQALEEDKVLVSMGLKIPDDARKARGWDPLPDGLGEEAIIITPQGAIRLRDALEQSAKPPAPPMPFGGFPGGGPGGPQAGGNQGPDGGQDQGNPPSAAGQGQETPPAKGQEGGKGQGQEAKGAQNLPAQDQKKAVEAAKLERAAREDLRKWRDKASHRVEKGLPPARFASNYLARPVVEAVQKALEGARTREDVDRVFQDVRLQVQNVAADPSNPSLVKASPAHERARVEAGLARIIRKGLARMLPKAQAWAKAALQAKTEKADGPVTDAWWDEFGRELVEEMGVFLAAGMSAGTLEASLMLGVDFTHPSQKAVEFAMDRAAELVGKKWVNGVLVDNPNPVWAITDSLRAQVAGLVQDGVEGGWSTKTLASNMADFFNTYRAEMVARTETGRAYNYGAAEFYKANGVDLVDPQDGKGCLPGGHDDSAPEPEPDQVGVQVERTVQGQRWRTEDIPNFPLGHPNCVRGFAPVPPLAGPSAMESEA